MFIPLSDGPELFGWKNNEFIIPKRTFILEAPGEIHGLTIENVEKIRTLLKKRKAKLAFENFSSIVYFTIHILQSNNISNPIARDCYQDLFLNVLMRPVFSRSQKTHADSEDLKKPMPHKINIPYLLLKALEETSNQVDIDDVDLFFLTVKKKFNILKEETTSKKPFLQPPSGKSNAEGHWNRLKKAYRFFWDTFDTAGKDFSTKQKQEWDDNKFYIRVVDGAYLISLITGFFFTVYLTQILSNKLDHYIEKKLQDIVNKK